MSTELAALAPESKVKGMLHLHAQECPHCKKSLVAQEITGNSRHLYLPLDTPDDGRFLFYSHIIHRSSHMHDRTLAYECPFCNTVDVIPGCEEMWDELMSGLEDEYAKAELLGKSEADPYAPAPEPYTLGDLVAQKFGQSSSLPPEQERFLSALEASVKPFVYPEPTGNPRVI